MTRKDKIKRDVEAAIADGRKIVDGCAGALRAKNILAKLTDEQIGKIWGADAQLYINRRDALVAKQNALSNMATETDALFTDPDPYDGIDEATDF